MGKAVFLLIAAAMLGATTLMFGGKQSAFESQSEQSEYQANVIARDIAESGYNEILSQVKRDKMNVTHQRSDVSMLGGSYDQRVTENMYGDLDIEVAGAFIGVEHRIASNVIFASPFPGAISLSDDEVEANGIGSGYGISGMDERAPSRGVGGGFLRPVAGIVTDDIHQQYISSRMSAANVQGVSNEDGTSGAPSVTDGFDKTFYEAIYQEARTKTNTSITLGSQPSQVQALLQSAAAASSPSNPQIVRAQGDLTINYPLHGYGMLIVEDGDLNVYSNDFRWEGLVLLRKEFADTVRVNLAMDTEIYGGVVGYSMGSLATPDCDGDFDIDGNEVVTQDSVQLTFTVLGAAISYGGQYDMPVTVKTTIDGTAYYPFGDWSKALDGNVNTGNSGVTHQWTPPQVYPPNTRILISARSWVKKSGYSGTRNYHWKIHMEKDNLVVDNQLAVLRDDAPVPNVGGYLGQYSVQDFLVDYIDNNNNKVTLDNSDAIYLYELGVNNPASPAHDMQDLVVLVTMRKAGVTSGCSTVAASGTSRIEFNMSGTSQVRYSGEAIAKLGKTLNTIGDASKVVVARNETFTNYQEGSYEGSTNGQQQQP